MNSRSSSLNRTFLRISKRIREARVARVERATFFASDFARFFAGFVIERISLIVRRRSASWDLPLTSVVIAQEKWIRTRRNVIALGKNSEWSPPPSRGNAVRHFTQSANSVKQAHRAFKGDLIGTKRPSEEILVVDTTVVSHPTFLFFTLPLEVCFHLVSIPCNCARTMNATPWTTLVLLSSNFLGSENRLLSDGEEEGRKDEGIEENSCGNYCEFTFIICKKFLLFNNVYEFEKI